MNANVGKTSKLIRLFAFIKLDIVLNGIIHVENIISVPEAGFGRTVPDIVPFVPEYVTDDCKNVLKYIILPAIFATFIVPPCIIKFPALSTVTVVPPIIISVSVCVVL